MVTCLQMEETQAVIVIVVAEVAEEEDLSIWTIADTLEGTGDMEANGGRGSCGGGDGSGGRIALQVENDGYDGSTF